jgi:outer membrane protein TolC
LLRTCTGRVRYRGGVSGYLEVLDTDTRLFNDELRLSQAQLDELVGAITLYKAVGGGWLSEETARLRGVSAANAGGRCVDQKGE